MSTLTLSGWTQPAEAVAEALPEETLTFDYSDYASPEASFEGLKPFANVDNIVAWSMGGQLALRAIAAGVLKPKHLTLIATPYQFVMSPGGMSERTFALFRENYVTDAARTKQRFHGLIAKGDRQMKHILGLLGHHPEVENTTRWLPWLDDLSRHSLADTTFQSLPPTLLIHGDGDAIVPHAQTQWLMARLPGAALSSWQGVGHAPHLHDATRLMQTIRDHRGQTA